MKHTAAEFIRLSHIHARPGKESQLAHGLQMLVKHTQNEEGCIAYELWQDLKNPRLFIMYERFQDEKAFDAHVAMPYVQDFIKKDYAVCVESQSNNDVRALIDDQRDHASDFSSSHG